jgi:hypothetical protein
MVLVNCPGCNKQYESGRSLRAHQRGPCGVAAKVPVRKRRKKAAKFSREDDTTEDAHVEICEGLREEINSFEAEEMPGAGGVKRKLRRGTVSHGLTLVDL